MTRTQGQALRRVGLVVEVLCMLGLLGLSRGKVEIWRGLPVEPSLFLTVGLGVGFLTWAAGTAAIYAGRKGPSGENEGR